MSTERKIFWAFLWLGLALVGLSYVAREVRVIVFVVPADSLLELPRVRSQKMHLSGGIFGPDRNRSVSVTNSAAHGFLGFPLGRGPLLGGAR
jgi:hypothetical protein